MTRKLKKLYTLNKKTVLEFFYNVFVLFVGVHTADLAALAVQLCGLNNQTELSAGHWYLVVTSPQF